MDENESDTLGFERGFEVSRQCNALHKYNILVGDFPDVCFDESKILHTGRISNRPKKYEPCESLETRKKARVLRSRVSYQLNQNVPTQIQKELWKVLCRTVVATKNTVLLKYH